MFKRKSKSSPQASLKLSEIQRATNNFAESSLIGKGFLGDVYYGEVFNGAFIVPAAIKRLTHEGPTTSWPYVERQRLYALRHRNLVSLNGYYSNEVKFLCEKETVLVYEYIPGRRTLQDHLHVLGTPLSWIQRLEICLGVAHGLHYLHTVGVMHGDIRSSNILMTQSLVPKITDYGLSELEVSLTDKPSYVCLNPGSSGYVEYYFGDYGGLTMKSDVYSLGAVFLELLCRKPVLDYKCSLEDPRRCLVRWFQKSDKSSRDLEMMIDPEVKKEVSTKCLEKVIEILKRFLVDIRQERADITEAVASLESLLLQERVNNPLHWVKEFSLDDLIIATSGFSQSPFLGHPRVFLGWVEQETFAPSDQEGVGIAIAVIPIASRDDWLEEVNFLAHLVHPNIIRLLGCCRRDGNENLLVYEHMQRSLAHFIHGDDRLEPLSWETRLNIMIGVARGMAYLYTDKGLLCNFQCDDILLDEGFNAKLGGFGWVEVEKRHDGKQLKGIFGCLKADYNTSTGDLPKNGVCSFGLVLLETVTAKHSDDVLVKLKSLKMGAPDSKSNKRKVKKMVDPRLKGNYSSEGAFICMGLALRCIAVQPECRPSCEEIVWSLSMLLKK